MSQTVSRQPWAVESGSNKPCLYDTAYALGGQPFSGVPVCRADEEGLCLFKVAPCVQIVSDCFFYRLCYLLKGLLLKMPLALIVECCEVSERPHISYVGSPYLYISAAGGQHDGYDCIVSLAGERAAVNRSEQLLCLSLCQFVLLVRSVQFQAFYILGNIRVQILFLCPFEEHFECCKVGVYCGRLAAFGKFVPVGSYVCLCRLSDAVCIFPFDEQADSLCIGFSCPLCAFYEYAPTIHDL